MSQESLTIKLRVICLHPPTYEGTVFGLQDKAQALSLGVKLPDGAVQFECEITANYDPETNRGDFSGAFVHGKRGERFLYLSLGPEGRGQWIRRVKVPLSGMTWEQIEAAAANQAFLEATVDGTRSGSVPLLGGGWLIR